MDNKITYGQYLTIVSNLIHIHKLIIEPYTH